METRRRFSLTIPAILLTTVAFVVVAVAQNLSEQPAAQQPRPYWAYAVNPELNPATAPAKPASNLPRHIPGSEATFTEPQVHDFFSAPDWHPSGHPAMPEVVAHGRKPDLFACGFCHLPNGQGRPENSRLAGLPAGYIVQQMADFKSGLRKSSESRRKPGTMMTTLATQANQQEIQVAAKYFSGLRPKTWIRVVETNTVPTTRVAGWMLVPSDPPATEPIGQRIIEVPENLEQTELRDDAFGFIAYVPVGSIQRGKALATTGRGDKAVACAKCHGPGLRGSGNVPAIAGRSPSYIVRQLYDIQSGARAGTLTQQMRAPAAKLTLDDMVALAAYTASLRP